jgi:succinyl-diaminopimelate desuccinylase
VTDRFDDNMLRDRLVELTRDLVIIPSTVSRPEERERCYQFVRNHIDVIEGLEIRDYRRSGYPSLVALPKGCQVPEVLLAAHLDVIELPETADYRSQLADGRIYGPGCGDMKGQLAILLELFRCLHVRHPGIPLGLAVTSDEEVGGLHGIGYLFGEGRLCCRQAFIPDGGSLDRVTVEEKGVLHVRLTARGRAGHAARPWLAANALDSVTDAVRRLRDRFAAFRTDDADHWYPTVTLTVLRTENTTVNRIPERAEAMLDIRFPPPFKTASIMETVRANLGESVEALVLIGDDPTHLAPDPLWLNLVRTMTGRTVRQTRESGGSDARYICRHGIPVLMTRPEVGNLHSEQEWIDIASMVAFYRIAERYLEERCLSQTRDSQQ